MSGLDPWYIDTGNYVLNYLVSGDFFKGFEGRLIHQLAGEEATGKSRVWIQAAQIFLRENPNAVVICFATENDFKSVACLREEFGERFIYIPGNITHEVQTNMLDILNKIIETEPNENDLKTMIVVDSWGFLASESLTKKAEDGKQSGMDLTTTKQKNDLISSLIYKPTAANCIIFITNHIYIKPQEYDNVEISGGMKFKYASNCILFLLKLGGQTKEANKDHGDATKKDRAIIRFVLRKGRFPCKENGEVKIPMEYNKGGLTRYGGLFKFAKECGAVELKSAKGGWYAWTDQPDNKFQKGTALKKPETLFTKERMDYIAELAYPLFCYTDDGELSFEIEEDDE